MCLSVLLSVEPELVVKIGSGTGAKMLGGRQHQEVFHREEQVQAKIVDWSFQTYK